MALKHLSSVAGLLTLLVATLLLAIVELDSGLYSSAFKINIDMRRKKRQRMEDCTKTTSSGKSELELWSKQHVTSACEIEDFQNSKNNSKTITNSSCKQEQQHNYWQGKMHTVKQRHKKTKSMWTPEQDALLLKAVKEFGCRWAFIVRVANSKSQQNWKYTLLSQKTRQWISQRYKYQLDPSISWSPFTLVEKVMIEKLFKEHGPKWSIITKLFNSHSYNQGQKSRRTDNQIKNLFYKSKSSKFHKLLKARKLLNKAETKKSTNVELLGSKRTADSLPMVGQLSHELESLSQKRNKTIKMNREKKRKRKQKKNFTPAEDALLKECFKRYQCEQSQQKTLELRIKYELGRGKWARIAQIYQQEVQKHTESNTNSDVLCDLRSAIQLNKRWLKLSKAKAKAGSSDISPTSIQSTPIQKLNLANVNKHCMHTDTARRRIKQRKSSKWSTQEDSQLVEAVKQFGCEFTRIKKWAKVENKYFLLQSKTSNQLHARYRYVLDPKINTSSFSSCEQKVVKRLYQQYGNQWSAITKDFNEHFLQQFQIQVKNQNCHQLQEQDPPRRHLTRTRHRHQIRNHILADERRRARHQNRQGAGFQSGKTTTKQIQLQRHVQQTKSECNPKQQQKQTGYGGQQQSDGDRYQTEKKVTIEGNSNQYYKSSIRPEWESQCNTRNNCNKIYPTIQNPTTQKQKVDLAGSSKPKFINSATYIDKPGVDKLQQSQYQYGKLYDFRGMDSQLQPFRFASSPKPDVIQELKLLQDIEQRIRYSLSQTQLQLMNQDIDIDIDMENEMKNNEQKTLASAQCYNRHMLMQEQDQICNFNSPLSQTQTGDKEQVMSHMLLFQHQQYQQQGADRDSENSIKMETQRQIQLMNMGMFMRGDKVPFQQPQLQCQDQGLFSNLNCDCGSNLINCNLSAQGQDEDGGLKVEVEQMQSSRNPGPHGLALAKPSYKSNQHQGQKQEQAPFCKYLNLELDPKGEEDFASCTQHLEQPSSLF